MFEKKMLVVFLILFSAGVFAGFTIGQTYTQQQIDSWSEQQIRNNINFELEKIVVEDDRIYFYLEYNNLKQDVNNYTGYTGIRDIAVLSFRVKQLNDCIADANKSYCLNDVLKPTIVNIAKTKKSKVINNILDLQTNPNNFTIQDLEGLISNEELN